jgi:hypothetical protein
MTPCELLLAIMLSEDPDSGWAPVWFVRPQHVDVVTENNTVILESKDAETNSEKTK